MMQQQPLKNENEAGASIKTCNLNTNFIVRPMPHEKKNVHNTAPLVEMLHLNHVSVGGRRFKSVQDKVDEINRINFVHCGFGNINVEIMNGLLIAFFSLERKEKNSDNDVNSLLIYDMIKEEQVTKIESPFRFSTDPNIVEEVTVWSVPANITLFLMENIVKEIAMRTINMEKVDIVNTRECTMHKYHDPMHDYDISFCFLQREHVTQTRVLKINKKSPKDVLKFKAVQMKKQLTNKKK